MSVSRIVAYAGGLAGLALLLVLLLRADWPDLAHLWLLAGWSLLWLIPYRALYFLLYALGWRQLLAVYDFKKRANIAYLWWVSSVREAIDRLLPVASLGGGVVGVRLLSWRGLATIPVGATVIVEVILTLTVSYLFAAFGVVWMLNTNAPGHQPVRHLWLAIACTFPVPVICILLLRHGALFVRLQRVLGAMIGMGFAYHAAQWDQELRHSMGRTRALTTAGALQLAALLSASFEMWFILRLFGHPIEPMTAVVLESAAQAVRHLAFFIPGALGVQEAGLIVFAGLYGISAELALGVSLAKRLREILCGVPALISWHWMEARRGSWSGRNMA